MNPAVSGMKRTARRPVSRLFAVAAGLFASLSSVSVFSLELEQRPLYLGSDVPGNLALVLSAEAPTLVSIANLGDYNQARDYEGYFDSAKCYKYVYTVSELDRHFYPVSRTSSRACPNTAETAEGRLWHGNFLNWAVTQAIDPFRKEMTGGYRVRDTATETFLEKAIADRDHEESSPNRTTPSTGANSVLVAASTPAMWGSFRTRLHNRGNKLWFTSAGITAQNGAGPAVAYNPGNALHRLSPECLISGFPHLQGDGPNIVGSTRCYNPARSNYRNSTAGDSSVVYELSVRVAVCVPGLLEGNCVKYGDNYKPEGLIQEYADRLTYSMFSYINNGRDGLGTGNPPDGGVMRAAQKFVGPHTYYPEEGRVANLRSEWSSTTGIQVANPDASYLRSADTSYYDEKNSGIINYINKFGQMETGRPSKFYDNVSELYYAAFRYFRGIENVPAYSALSTNATTKMQQADRFPVIRWDPVKDDPIQYHCQVNAILGIGDTNTAADKALPGSPRLSANGEGTIPVDPGVDVVEDLRRIFRLEGRAYTRDEALANYSSGGSNKSAYIAALAYHANLRDLRPGMQGTQRLSTYWVDIVEFFDYKNQLGVTRTAVGTGTTSGNQYWLAAKYGDAGLVNSDLGANPDFDVSKTAPAFDLNRWSAVDQNVRHAQTNAVVFQRPNNYYTASDARTMGQGLRLAFESFLDDVQGSASSFASNTTRLEHGGRTYQAQFISGRNEWGGELNAFNVNTSTGALTRTWSASEKFPVWGPTNATAGARKIFYARDGSLAAFQGAVAGLSVDTVNYLRGDRSKEQSNGGTLRNRRSVLGDIVNSQPTYVGAPNSRLFIGRSFAGASAYAGFASAQASRTPVIYVGANDGMLHAFNADTGVELFAFVPTEGVAKLHGAKGYSSPDYEHTYTVDGMLTAADWYDGTAWRTVVVGTMGRGGKSVFALDVTDPASPRLMWETTSSSFGNNLGQPIVAQVADGDWRVLMGNGPNSSDGVARLVSIALKGGVVHTVSAGSGSGNGLYGVNAWSPAGDGIFNTAYAGDNKGNLWRFDIGAGTASVLFAAGDTKPITATPLVAKNPRTLQTWVFVGTGRYLNSADVSNKDVQTWYGLIDRGVKIDAADLKSIDITNQGVVSGRDVRVIESVNSPGTSGWKMDLLPPNNTPQGERMVVPNFFQGLALIGTSRIPDANDVCSPSGKGFTMAINPFTGGRLSSGFFDVTGDGHVDAKDTLDGVPVSGIGFNSSPNNPIFLGDVMFTSLDDGTSSIIKTNASASDVRRVSWRELIRN